MQLQEFALIVAGGSGTRMKSNLPKQFLEIQGKPVLMHTIERFHQYSSAIQIILVLPEKDIPFWKDLCNQHNFTVPHQIQKGGKSRFQSVKNGLELVASDSIVAIHDGVRPLVHPDIIGASYHIAALHKTAVAAVRLKESIRMTDKDTTTALDRSKFRLIQTPQTFLSNVIKEAYLQEESNELTDDASVAEKAGYEISLFEGSYENIKITTPEDLWIADMLLKQQLSATN